MSKIYKPVIAFLILLANTVSASVLPIPSHILIINMENHGPFWIK